MNRKKVLVRCLALLLLVVAVVGVTLVSAAETTPRAAGLCLEDMPIVLPAEATDVEKTAAKELQHYLKEMTGKNSSVITEGVSLESAIYLGATKFAKENNVTYTDKNGQGEGWAIKAIGSDVVLTGGETRGTLYAVYHLLEDHFGVHWWNMWEEYVPSMEDAVVPFDYDHSGEPLFADRAIYFNETKTSLYYVRNRLNGFTSNAPAAYGGEINYAKPYHVHTFNRMFPAYYSAPTSASAAAWTDAINPEGISWFEAHPEWFAYSKARGERISYGQMCLTNKELMQEFGNKAIKAIELSYEEADANGVARPSYIDVSPNDMAGHCECDECVAVEAASGPSGRLLKFVNAVAEVVETVYPEIKVETLAYDDYFELPLDGTKPRHNVVIRLASSDVDIVHDMDHPNNAKVKKRLYEWGDLLDDGQLMYWDYGIVLGDYGVLPNMFKFGRDYRQVYECGGVGVFTEFQRSCTVDFWDMKHWILTKVMEDPYQKEEELAMTFLTGYYGEAAAEPLLNYLYFMEDEAAEHYEIITFSDKLMEAPWLSAEDILKGNAYFEEAIAALEADDSLSAADRELFLNRVAAARGGLDRLILTNYTDYAMEMYEAGKSFGLDRQEVGKRMVAGLTWLMAMENEADYTGIENWGVRKDSRGQNALDSYSKYADEDDPVTGETIDRPDIPQQIYEDHPGISDVHIHDYLADSFFQAGIYIQYPHVDKVSHAASWGGTAVVVDYKTLYDWCDQYGGTYTSYLFSETKPLTTNLGSLYLNKPLIADGEYHLYRIPNHVVLREGKTLISFFNDVIRFSVKDLEWLADDPVDVYVSMKIEGDPSGENKNNPAKLSIERVLLVEPCYAYDISYDQEIPATCAKGTTMVGTCPVCGKEAEKEIAGTKLSHKMVSDYVYDAATKTYKGQCADCGEVEYQFAAELPANVLADMKEANLGLDRVHEFTVGDFTTSAATAAYQDIITDPDSKVGTTVFWDLNKMSNYGHFEITNNKPFWDWDNKIPSDLYADDFIADGQYHTYRLQNVSLITEDSQEFIFFNWTLRVPMPKLAYLEGRKVDVYFSMKIDGELDFSDPSNLPDYYVDRVLVVETCPEHAADEYTYNEQTGVYEGQCRNCGKVVSYKFRAKLPQRVVDDMNAEGNDPQHIHDFGPSDLRQSSSILSFVDDPESPYGRAAKLDVSKHSKPHLFVNPTDAVRSVGLSAKGQIASLDLDEMIAASEEGGYHTYKLDDLVMPEVGKGYGYFHFLYSYFQSYNVAYKMGDLAGKTVDIYLSMKIDKPLGNSEQIPNYYVDRIIVADNCGNHLNEESRELISTGTCYEGNIYSAVCDICGRTVETEDPATRLPHDFGEYVTSADGKSQVAQCRNDGCTVTKTVSLEAALPQRVLDDLKAEGIDPTHVFDFGPSHFRTGTTSLLSFVDDPDSPYGRAAKVVPGGGQLNNLINPTQTVRTVGLSTKGALGVMDYNEMVQANKDGGYHAYRIANVTLPEVGNGYGYFHALNYYFQSYNVAYKLDDLAGKTVDIYVSMKIEGEIGNKNNIPVYYVDRFIIVTDCEDYDLTFVETPGEDCTTPGVQTAVCPHCGKEVVKEGTTASHSFTQYFRDTLDMYKYVAKCDRGCGATDVKYDQRLSVQEKLPAELPESVKKHVLFSYSCDEFILSGPEDPYMWDLELDRPVGVLDYARNYESSSMVYTGNTGPIACMYPSGAPSHGLGEFKGVAANSGKGYQLYSIKNVIPIKERAYNYFYMFSSWVLQIHMLDDDLIKNDYRGKSVDLYLYMKAEGDTSCVTEDKPIYYIDQIIVAESCTTDETWEVVREATCTQTGLMKGNCAVCGLEGAEVEIPMLPHVMTKTVLEKKATCYANEVRYGLCDVCGTRDSQQVENTTLTHSFSKYVKQEDGVTEIAYCDNGCGERHIRNSASTGENIQLPENVQQLLPIFGAAGGREFSFSDIKTTDWYFESVKNAWENKLIDGVSATEYRPDDTLTVAQAVKLASAYHERYNTGDVTLTNGAGSWYSSYVDYAVENGIIDSKYSSYTNAQMNKTIDRSEFVAIFEKAMDEEELVGYNTVSDNAIPDVKMDDANADAIYKFYRAGILTGSDGKGTFNPDSSIKRSEVAAILSRMFDSNVRQSITLN